MGGIGDPVPWSSLKWTLTIHDARGPVELSMGQAFLVFAAVELDRVWSLDDVRRACARAKNAAEFWSVLMQGARGVKPTDAAGDMTIEAVFTRLSVVNARWAFERSRAQNVAALGAVLAEAS